MSHRNPNLTLEIKKAIQKMWSVTSMDLQIGFLVSEPFVWWFGDLNRFL